MLGRSRIGASQQKRASFAALVFLLYIPFDPRFSLDLSSPEAQAMEEWTTPKQVSAAMLIMAFASFPQVLSVPRSEWSQALDVAIACFSIGIPLSTGYFLRQANGKPARRLVAEPARRRMGCLRRHNDLRGSRDVSSSRSAQRDMFWPRRHPGRSIDSDRCARGRRMGSRSEISPRIAGPPGGESAVLWLASFRRPFITRPVIIDDFAFGRHCGIAGSFDFHMTAIIIASFLQQNAVRSSRASNHRDK